MRFQIFSDLHLEHFGEDEKSIRYILNQLRTDAYYILVAGDVFSEYNLDFHAKIFADVFSDKHVIYIPGNHEYYYTDRETMNSRLRDVLGSHGITFLDNGYEDFGDVIVIGSCGWADRFNEVGCRMMNDFRLIRDLVVDRHTILKWGRESKEYIEEAVKSNQYKKIVCLTHNAPMLDMIPSKYLGSPLNEFFANDWSDLIRIYNIDLWVSGHFHQYKHIKRHDTTLIENGFGYFINQEVHNFKPNLVIDI